MWLEKINSPYDLKNVPENELTTLAKEIRNTLINKASHYGGHLASNLGSVELTIAVHYVFDFTKDKIVFDVSHQCYTHKILTGRKEFFLDSEKYNDVSGFTNPLESPYDLFNIGHTSTSISLASGLAKARNLRHSNENIVAFIGDSALDGGEAFEALSYLSELDGGFILIVNDNHMSIPENHGFFNSHLQSLYESKGMAKENIFKTLGFKYLFVEDGHDIHSLIKVFNSVKDTNKHVVIHCRTIKGKGYEPAENNQEKWHHAHPFCVKTGEFEKRTSVPTENYGSIIGDYLSKKIKQDKSLVAMTASVPACFGFNPIRRKEAGDQFVDVGICEQHLISMACGLAQGGFNPVAVTESSFYQRAYDQIEQELDINKCPATFLIAFSGIYGHDDNTHIGFYDISLFSNLKNTIFLAPTSKEMYLSMIEWSINQRNNPVFIRIPWNGVHYDNTNSIPNDFSKTAYRVTKKGSIVAILALGSFYQLGECVCELLEERGIEATLIDPVFASGLDKRCLDELKSRHRIVVTLEDGILEGGFGSKIAQYYGSSDIKVLNFGFSNNIPTKFDREELIFANNLKPNQVVDSILKLI